jgi:hypothetical protein
MGQGYTKPRKHSKYKPFNRKNPIKVLHIDAKIEKRATIIDETSSSVLKYRTPHFRQFTGYLLLKNLFTLFLCLAELQQV